MISNVSSADGGPTTRRPAQVPGVDSIPGVLELLLDAMPRDMAAGAGPTEAIEGRLERAASQIARLARIHGCRAEQMVVSVKQHWSCIVAARRWTAEPALTEVRTRLVSLSIRSFYSPAPTRRKAAPVRGGRLAPFACQFPSTSTEFK